MKRNVPLQSPGAWSVRLASLVASVTFTAGMLVTLVGAMPPLEWDDAYAGATLVTIEPARIEVTAQRPTATVHNAAEPHVG